MTIDLPEETGVCRWCGCSDDVACPAGCCWVNVDHTLCSSCFDIDELVRSARGRVALADYIQGLPTDELNGLRVLGGLPERRVPGEDA